MQHTESSFVATVMLERASNHSAYPILGSTGRQMHKAADALLHVLSLCSGASTKRLLTVGFML